MPDVIYMTDGVLQILYMLLSCHSQKDFMMLDLPFCVYSRDTNGECGMNEKYPPLVQAFEYLVPSWWS